MFFILQETLKDLMKCCFTSWHLAVNKTNPSLNRFLRSVLGGLGVWGVGGSGWVFIVQPGFQTDWTWEIYRISKNKETSLDAAFRTRNTCIKIVVLFFFRKKSNLSFTTLCRPYLPFECFKLQVWLYSFYIISSITSKLSIY